MLKQGYCFLLPRREKEWFKGSFRGDLIVQQPIPQVVMCNQEPQRQDAGKNKDDNENIILSLS